MSITLQDLLNELDDASGNYDTGSVSLAIKKRHINRAIEWSKRKLGFPTDERIQEINFSEDQLYYNTNSDFDEALYLFYNEESENIPGDNWEPALYGDILRRRGEGDRRHLFGETHINGTKQVAIHGYNKRGSSTLYDMDSVGDWTVDDDASNLTLDENQKKFGSGSLNFDIVNSAGTASLINASANFSIKELILNDGYIKFWNYMTDADIDDVTLWLYQTDSKYYTITETDQDDSTAFEANKWTKLGFGLENRVEVGSPDIDDNITKIRIEYDLGAGFVSATDFRVDQIFQVFPDKLDFIYKSNIKGTDSAGTTNKTTLGELDDIALLGHDDLAPLIGMRAAITLWPALRADAEWYRAYKVDLRELLRDFARRAPRVRTAGSRSTRLAR